MPQIKTYSSHYKHAQYAANDLHNNSCGIKHAKVLKRPIELLAHKQIRHIRIALHGKYGNCQCDHCQPYNGAIKVWSSSNGSLHQIFDQFESKEFSDFGLKKGNKLISLCLIFLKNTYPRVH